MAKWSNHDLFGYSRNGLSFCMSYLPVLQEFSISVDFSLFMSVKIECFMKLFLGEGSQNEVFN